jgi:SAM-dependent methyltransferase
LIAKKEYLWKEISETFQKNLPQDLWRAHSDAVNKALLMRWWPVDRVDQLLKTDLFDEAANEGLYPFLDARANHVLGMDISFPVASQARLRYPGFQTTEADVRCLPFMDNTFDLIVSNSTLDHFESIEEIAVSLRELHRVLRPGKQMIITLDNPSNPIVFLRNWLPFRLLQRLKIVPYYVGVTLGQHRLQHLLKDTGFKVLEVDAIMHCPRVLAVAVARWIQKYSRLKIQGHYLRFLQAFDCLSRLPTRFFTGHFIAIRAVRC